MAKDGGAGSIRKTPRGILRRQPLGAATRGAGTTKKLEWVGVATYGEAQRKNTAKKGKGGATWENTPSWGGGGLTFEAEFGTHGSRSTNNKTNNMGMGRHPMNG